MKSLLVLRILVLLDALLMAAGHVPLIRILLSKFPMALPIGGYFLISTIIYVLGGIFIASGKLSKLSNMSLILLAVVDNLLLVYTRTMPSIFFNRTIPWSWEWFPPGTGQIFIGQIIILVLCAILLQKSKA